MGMDGTLRKPWLRGGHTEVGGAGASPARTRHSNAAWAVRFGILAFGLILVLVTLVPGSQPAGAAMGEGWIASPPGACALDRSLTGPARFDLGVTCEAAGARPQGRIVFDLGEGDFRFESTSTETMNLMRGVLTVTGTGTVSGNGGYGFALSARDGKGSDQLRLKVWDKASGALVYDNQPAAPRGHQSSRLAAIGGGSIEIQQSLADVSPTSAGDDRSGSKRRSAAGRWG